MKMLILAAGKGTRLTPLTNNKPKCMVEYRNTPIIDYILKCAKKFDLNDIAIVTGYKAKVLRNYLNSKNITFFHNDKFAQTNMVYTMFCAEKFMNDDLIISYADIIYDCAILKTLIQSKSDFAVIVDKKWKELWKIRMENPLLDAETLKIENNKIVELGKKPSSYDEIHGQYIGLIKISANILPKVKKFYHSLDKDVLYDGKDYNNMYMTTFIQLIIDNLLDVTPVYINGGWLEIDSVNDLKNYENMNKKLF